MSSSATTETNVIDTSDCLKRMRGLAPEAFLEARPFPLLVIDDFLPAAMADGLCEEIARHEEFRKSNDYIFAKNKFEDAGISRIGPCATAYRDLLLSDGFRTELTRLTRKEVFVDPDFTGGGLHRGGEGSYLEMHVDFGIHPGKHNWIRELNLLLYLNRGWKPEYAGSLELRHAHTDETRVVEPLFNRLVIMLTKDFTYHGYRPISFPAGTFRTSIAAYAYQEAKSEEDLKGLLTTTRWDPVGGGLLRKAAAAVTPTLVTVKQRLLGSSTAKRR